MRHFWTILRSMLVIGAATACNSALIPSPTPTVTPIQAMPTSSVITWQSGPVLALFSNGGCPDSCFNLYFSQPPDMILYANGQQMVYTKGRLFERRLSSEEVCILLRNVEHIGYFDYDSNLYRQHFAQQPRRGLVGVCYLSVHAWKSNEMVLPGVHSHALDPDKIQPELRQPAEVYQQFMKYDLSKFELYQPKQLAVYIAKQTQPVEPNFPAVDWEPSLPALSSLEQRLKTAQSQNHIDEIIVSGDEAQAIATMFDNDPWPGLKFFKDGNEEYGVAIRALLPYETTGGNVNKMAQIPSSEAHYSSVELSCPN